VPPGAVRPLPPSITLIKSTLTLLQNDHAATWVGQGGVWLETEIAVQRRAYDRQLVKQHHQWHCLPAVEHGPSSNVNPTDQGRCNGPSLACPVRLSLPYLTFMSCLKRGRSSCRRCNCGHIRLVREESCSCHYCADAGQAMQRCWSARFHGLLHMQLLLLAASHLL
jgi:hypothetical protein